MTTSSSRDIREFTGSTYHQGMSDLLKQGFYPLTVADCIQERINALSALRNLDIEALDFWGKGFQTGDAVAYWRGKIKLLAGSHGISTLKSYMRAGSRDYFINPDDFQKLPEQEIEFKTLDYGFHPFNAPLAKEVWTRLVGSWDKVCEYRDLLKHHGIQTGMQVWFASYWEYERKNSSVVVRIWQIGSLPDSDIDAMYFIDDADPAMPRVRLLGSTDPRLLYQLCEEKEAPPLELIECVNTITVEVIKYLKKHPRELYNLKSRQFEKLIAELLSAYDWQVQLTRATKDGGYDIFAVTKDISGVQTSWIIECKKNAPRFKVDVRIVRALYAVKMDLRIANAMLATTSHFTKGVCDYKSSRYDLELRDYEGILEWLNVYKPNPSGQLYLKDNRLILPGDN